MGKGRSKVYTIPVNPAHFRAVDANLMLFQVCKDDKTVDVGDRLVLVETDGDNAPSGAVMACVVTYKQPGGALGIEPGHCVSGLYKKGAQSLLLITPL